MAGGFLCHNALDKKNEGTCKDAQMSRFKAARCLERAAIILYRTIDAVAGHR